MKTKYELKPIRDACEQTHRRGGLCRGDLNPKGTTDGTVYVCQDCGHEHTTEEAMTAKANRNERYDKRDYWNEQAKAANARKFVHVADSTPAPKFPTDSVIPGLKVKPPTHLSRPSRRAVDRAIAINSHATVNGVPMMTTAEAAFQSVMTAVVASTPAPTNMKEVKQ
jgi:hypothetical protein|tara:strand:- start:2478 stop:2978 length:501 start_codon:yes stop_codon:yes gene_type:complete